jgi:ketosteroid isomerase-like protein
MKNPIIIFVTLVLIISGVIIIPAQTDINQQAVLDQQRAFASAILKSDWKKLEALCHDDLIYTHSFGRVDTKSEFLTNRAKLRVEQWENETPSIKVYKNTAIVHSNLKVKLTRPNGEVRVSQQRATDVWVLHNKKWLLVSHQSTSYQ